MCRWAYVTVPAATTLGGGGLKSYFRGLEASFGGDGNGLGWFNRNGVKIRKGQKVKTDELASLATNIHTPCLFHTRKASVGSKEDNNCQPFEAGLDYLVCHNGTWNTWSDAAVSLRKMAVTVPPNISDTGVMALAVEHLGLSVVSEFDHAGIVAVMDTEGITVWRISGFSAFISEDGTVVGSELPFSWSGFEIESGTVVRVTATGTVTVLRGSISKNLVKTTTIRPAGSYRQGTDLSHYGERYGE